MCKLLRHYRKYNICDPPPPKKNENSNKSSRDWPGSINSTASVIDLVCMPLKSPRDKYTHGYYSAVMRRPTAMTVVPVQRTTSIESSTGPSTMVEFVHFSMLTALHTHKYDRSVSRLQIRFQVYVQWIHDISRIFQVKINMKHSI